jgi:hypothetical protein
LLRRVALLRRIALLGGIALLGRVTLLLRGISALLGIRLLLLGIPARGVLLSGGRVLHGGDGGRGVAVGGGLAGVSDVGRGEHNVHQDLAGALLRGGEDVVPLGAGGRRSVEVDGELADGGIGTNCLILADDSEIGVRAIQGESEILAPSGVLRSLLSNHGLVLGLGWVGVE